MRTILVNPSRRRHRKRRKNAPKPWAKLYSNNYYAGLTKQVRPKRKRRGASRPKNAKLMSYKDVAKALKNRPTSKGNPHMKRRRRRHNAGITPFIMSNPMSRFSNPRHSLTRRKRRNPSLSIPSLSLTRIVKKSITYGSGAAIGTGSNIFVLNKIVNPWLRNGARVLVGCMGAPMLGGELGAAAAGALFAPLVTDLAVMLNLPGIATEADLEADLQDLLDDMDEGEPSGVSMEADLW